MRRREVYLWIQHLQYHHERIHHFFESFPGLRELHIASYFDAGSTAVVLRLSYIGSRSRLRAWAESAGLQFVDATKWSSDRRREFRRALSPFGLADAALSPKLDALANGMAAAAAMRRGSVEFFDDEWTASSMG